MYMYVTRLHVRAHLLPAGLYAGCAVRVRGCRLCVAYPIEYISIARSPSFIILQPSATLCPSYTAIHHS